MSNGRRASFQLKRRDSMSPERRTSTSNYLYLREEGEARMVFVKTSDEFEGVFINKNEDVFALHGILTENNGTDQFKCNLNIYDEETGSEYSIKDILITVLSDGFDDTVDNDVNSSNNNNDKDLGRGDGDSSDLGSSHSDMDESVEEPDLVDGGGVAVVEKIIRRLSSPSRRCSLTSISEDSSSSSRRGSLIAMTMAKGAPRRGSLIERGIPIEGLTLTSACFSCPFNHRPIAMHSQSVEFATEDILMGARADQEIVRRLNSSLVGRNLCVYAGRMRISACKHVAPHRGFTARRMSKEFYEEIDAIQANDFLL